MESYSLILTFAIIIIASVAFRYIYHHKKYRREGTGGRFETVNTLSAIVEKKKDDTNNNENVSTTLSSQASGETTPSSFSSSSVLQNLMEQSNCKCCIFFGSQTGTAEEFSRQLSTELKEIDVANIVLDPNDFDLQELKDISSEFLIFFILATHGEGEPTDNAKDFYQLLISMKDHANYASILHNLHYCIFGLGDRTYNLFNFMGTEVDKSLSELGAVRIGSLGSGDADKCIEEDFLLWKENIWMDICSFFKVDPKAVLRPIKRAFSIKELNDIQVQNLKNNIYTGEVGILRSKQSMKFRKFYDIKNPYDATISAFNLLNHPESDKKMMHIEIDLGNSGIHYQTGDHIGIFPKNDPDMVERLSKRLGITNLDQVIQMTPIDKMSIRKEHFPTPCSYRTALTYYLDISSMPKTNILKTLAFYTEDSQTKDFFLRFATSAGRIEYENYILSPSRTLLDILEEYKDIQIPKDILLEQLPRLHCRYYSISSSPRMYPKSVHLTVSLAEFQTSRQRRKYGVTTKWMYETGKNPNSYSLTSIPMYIRKSSFKLPRQTTTPLILIGPGSGIAPFIGFFQEREFLQSRGSILGPCFLFFGCRTRSKDYIYEHEFLTYMNKGVISKLQVAFSRDSYERIYVQDLMSQCDTELYDLIAHKDGHIYVCGDAKVMAKDVLKEWKKIMICCGSMNESDASSFIKKLRSDGRYLEDIWS